MRSSASGILLAFRQTSPLMLSSTIINGVGCLRFGFILYLSSLMICGCGHCGAGCPLSQFFVVIIGNVLKKPALITTDSVVRVGESW